MIAQAEIVRAPKFPTPIFPKPRDSIDPRVEPEGEGGGLCRQRDPEIAAKACPSLPVIPDLIGNPVRRVGGA